MNQCCSRLMFQDKYCRVCGGKGSFAYKNMFKKNKPILTHSCGAAIEPEDCFCGSCGKPIIKD